MNKPGPSTAKPLSVLLSNVFSDAYAKQGFAARELVTRWAEIIGPELSAHCEPLKMQWPRPVEGQPQEPATLVLRVDGPMALEIASKSPMAVRAAKRSFNVGEDLPLRDAYRFEQSQTVALASSDETKEAQRAFAEKRKPVFKGR